MPEVLKGCSKYHILYKKIIMWEVLEKKIEMFNVPLVEFQGVILCSGSILGEEEQCITHIQIKFHA
jgi:hypothetical protein